ncbi:acyl carrier protein, partial [Streptomyces sp. M2CJ-2]|uniref:acyl carrier protein n=1 Tax=Streptomyces sp. M2CJ-2 TaxID=2803948 RepID=UPI001926285C
NRLDKHTGRRLPATLIFDYPSPHDLAHHLLTQFHPEETAEQAMDPEERSIRDALNSIPLARLRETGLLDTLLSLSTAPGAAAAEEADRSSEIEEMSAEDLVRAAMSQLMQSTNDDGE